MEGAAAGSEVVGGARIVIDGPVGPKAEPSGEDFGARSWVNTNADPSQNADSQRGRPTRPGAMATYAYRHTPR